MSTTAATASRLLRDNKIIRPIPHVYSRTDVPPVEPNPPDPRTVSPKASLSKSVARDTGATTSWAILRPRVTSKGSEP